MLTLFSPAQLIKNLLDNSPMQFRAAVLERARDANQRQLKQLEDERLQASEKGWEDYWKERHTRTTETLAEIERALATC
jgi:hypothetical protein